MSNICPECNGTGEYRGLNVVEPCKACGGKTVDKLTNNIAASTNRFTEAYIKAAEVCKQFASDGLLSRNDVRQLEQVRSLLPITLEYHVQSIKQIGLSNRVFTEDIDFGYRIEKRFMGQHCHMRLIGVESGSHDYEELLMTDKQINLTVVLPDGYSQTVENVRLLSHQPITKTLCNVEFEWEKRIHES